MILLGWLWSWLRPTSLQTDVVNWDARIMNFYNGRRTVIVFITWEEDLRDPRIYQQTVYRHHQVELPNLAIARSFLEVIREHGKEIIVQRDWALAEMEATL